MLLSVIFLICVALKPTTGQLTTGLYRIFNQWDFSEALAQDGSSVVTIGGIPSNDVKTVWYITPGSAADTYTIQNVKTLQYISVDGAPVSGSVPVPRASPFLWIYRQTTGEFGVNNLTLSIFLSSRKPTLLSRAGTDPSQNWRFTGSLPFPATYRIWNVATDSYLTAPASVPGVLAAGPLDTQNALQYCMARSAASLRTGATGASRSEESHAALGTSGLPSAFTCYKTHIRTRAHPQPDSQSREPRAKPAVSSVGKRRCCQRSPFPALLAAVAAALTRS